MIFIAAIPMKAVVIFLLLLASTVASFSQKAIREEEATFHNGVISLSGVILFPTKPVKPAIGVVMIHGSGNNDRDNKWMRELSEALVQHGIFVLLPDKRGCGKSKGDWKTSDFRALAMDAIAGVQYLSDRLKSQRVGILGVSQGGQVAPLAASLSNEVKFIINVAGAGVPLEDQMIHETVNTCRKKGMNADQIREVLALHASMKDYVVNEDWNRYENKLFELKNSTLAEFAAPFPTEKDAWFWTWARLNLSYNPIPHWKTATQPALILFGEEDERDNVPVWRSVYALESTLRPKSKSDYQVRVFEKTGHAFYDGESDSIREDVINLLQEWIKAKAPVAIASPKK